MPEGITDLCRFYADQYGMIFYAVYDPVFFCVERAHRFPQYQKKLRNLVRRAD